MYFFKEKYARECHIYNMLKNAPAHTSFHTPGHKIGKWDLTELSFSDNLAYPQGVIKQAEEDITRILGADRSFILTDGSTSGILSMIYAVNPKKLLAPVLCHKSVYNACKLIGAELVTIPAESGKINAQNPSPKAIENALKKHHCDAVLLTSPDYYGNIPDLAAVKAVCLGHGIPLLIDGAHGSHLHGTPLYAGNFADLWVDGVHKNLPSFTQGAVVSAKGKYVDDLREAVGIFRTTSPNYLIMAGVEYAVKYPRNEKIERLAEKLKKEFDALPNDDWTKIVIRYGVYAQQVNELLEKLNIYAEFCDGENIMFYLSPMTTKKELETLKNALLLFENEREYVATMPEPVYGIISKTRTWVPLSESLGMTCATEVGIFPPCIPLFTNGEVITEEKLNRLQKGVSTFGLREDGYILVYERNEKR